MKKLLKVLSVTTLSLLFSTSILVNAMEFPEGKVSKDERFTNFESRAEEKKDERMDIAKEKHAQRKDKREIRSEQMLEIVSNFAPELYEDYEEAVNSHEILHLNLFNKHEEIRESHFAEIKIEVQELKDELFAQVEAGELTFREARDQIQDFMKTNRESLKAELDAFRDEISDEADDWKSNQEVIKGLFEDLKVAIDSEDTESANEIIYDLYNYLLDHIQFDQFKLDTLNEMF